MKYCLSSLSTMTLLLLLSLLSIGSCSSVKYVYFKPDYETKDKPRLKRIAFSIEASEYSTPDIDKLIKVILKDYFSTQRNYILFRLPLTKQTNVHANANEFCRLNERLNGVLGIQVHKLRMSGDQVKLGIRARLHDCAGVRIWAAYGENTFDTKNTQLRSLTGFYVNRVGPGIRDLVAPFYILLREIFEKLPDPILTKAEKLEKIDSLY